MSSNNLIRVNLVIDKDSMSFHLEKEWLNYNDTYKRSLSSGVRFEIHENYPSLVANIKAFQILDIARQMSEGYVLSSILSSFRWIPNLDSCEELPVNGNVMDLYLNPGENCYYIDRECTNAVVLMIFMGTTLRSCPIGLRDKFPKKYYRAFDNDSVLIINTNEDRETMIGRIRRIVSIYTAEVGMSDCRYKWEEDRAICVEDNRNSVYSDSIIYIM